MSSLPEDLWFDILKCLPAQDVVLSIRRTNRFLRDVSYSHDVWRHHVAAVRRLTPTPPCTIDNDVRADDVRAMEPDRLVLKCLALEKAWTGLGTAPSYRSIISSPTDFVTTRFVRVIRNSNLLLIKNSKGFNIFDGDTGRSRLIGRHPRGELRTRVAADTYYDAASQSIVVVLRFHEDQRKLEFLSIPTNTYKIELLGKLRLPADVATVEFHDRNLFCRLVPSETAGKVENSVLKLDWRAALAEFQGGDDEVINPKTAVYARLPGHLDDRVGWEHKSTTPLDGNLVLATYNHGAAVTKLPSIGTVSADNSPVAVEVLWTVTPSTLSSSPKASPGSQSLCWAVLDQTAFQIFWSGSQFEVEYQTIDAPVKVFVTGSHRRAVAYTQSNDGTNRMQCLTGELFRSDADNCITSHEVVPESRCWPIVLQETYGTLYTYGQGQFAAYDFSNPVLSRNT